MRKQSYIYLLLIASVVAVVVWRNYNFQPAPVTPANYTDKNFDRNLRPLIYTKHARCRMGCRHIDAAEVEDILMNGRINYAKSEPDGRPDPKYAVEGLTKDHQDVRIIFAPSVKGMVVITCIDLKEEWACDCK